MRDLLKYKKKKSMTGNEAEDLKKVVSQMRQEFVHLQARFDEMEKYVGRLRYLIGKSVDDPELLQKIDNFIGK